MVIDFVIELPCEPKRRLRPPGILTLLRRIETSQGGGEPVGQEDAAAREAGFRLRPLAFHCAQCPANHANSAFGCHGRIHAPLSAAAEEWLADQWPSSLTAREDWTPDQRAQLKSFRRLLEFIEREKVTGAAAEVERSSGGMFLRKKPRRKRYGPLFRRSTSSSSQILELLFLAGRVEPDVGELVCRALGVWVDLESAEDGVAEVLFTAPEEPEDDPSLVDVKQYLHALMVASSLSVPVKLVLDDELGA